MYNEYSEPRISWIQIGASPPVIVTYNAQHRKYKLIMGLPITKRINLNKKNTKKMTSKTRTSFQFIWCCRE